MGGVRYTKLLRRLWMMLAHYHGQTINYADLSKSLASSQPTLKNMWLYLESSFMVRVLKPWHANLKKRQVKKSENILPGCWITSLCIKYKRVWGYF